MMPRDRRVVVVEAILVLMLALSPHLGVWAQSAAGQGYPAEYYGADLIVKPLRCELGGLTRAYVTLVSSDNYGEGALVLARSLAAVSSDTLVVMVTPNVTGETRQGLRGVGAVLCEVDVLRSPYQNCGYLCESYTKLQTWRLQLQRVVFLDADALVLASVDDLFHAAPMEGVAAANDCCSGTFNTGVMALRPSTVIFAAMMKQRNRLAWAVRHSPQDDFAATMGKEDLRERLGHSDHSDQGFLWMMFREDDGWHRLPVEDNFLKDCRSLGQTDWLQQPDDIKQMIYDGARPDLCDEVIARHLLEIRVVHYIGAKKPWMCPRDQGDCELGIPSHNISTLFQLWWQRSSPKLHHGDAREL